jgi:hypothetical protein
METRYFVNASGQYLGAFCGEEAIAAVPEEAVEVPAPPHAAHHVWNGYGWTIPA